MKFRFMFVLAALFLLSACTGSGTFTPIQSSSGTQEAAPSLQLSSTAFPQGGAIPEKYSCDGEDISPPLAWGDPPAGTQSLVLTLDDPDAPVGTWDHWVVFNLPADRRDLSEAASAGEVAATFGKNSWGRNDYGGPCPPTGTHRYYFKLYALDIALDLGENAGKKQVLAAMQGHVLAQGELMGTYSK